MAGLDSEGIDGAYPFSPNLFLVRLRMATHPSDPLGEDNPVSPVAGSTNAPASVTAARSTRRKTLNRITKYETEGTPSLEGYLLGLDYADLADAIWRASSCPAEKEP